MHILVIKSKKAESVQIKKGLRDAGYSVDVVADGRKAMPLVASFAYSLILLDMQTAENGGMKIIHDLRKEGISTPILCLAEKKSIDELVTALERGADAYLVKPISWVELAARVRALLRRKAMDRTAELRFAGLRIDPVTRKVWFKNREIKLTTKEYELLEFLMRNPNRELARETIIESVWGRGVSSNIVDVYINYLRNKIDRFFGSDLLQTVTGVGYRLREADFDLN